MADPASPSAATDVATNKPAKPPSEGLKKGALVRLNPLAYRDSLEASASDAELPGYAVAGPGEILAVKGEYAQIRWRRPVPDVWLRLDQLEAWRP
ncbi:MAG: NAD(P)H-quinone oxidoreductase subunit O [Cyanobacteriota bacterium]|nr:NAD(P)H-quinone oxidoreductase subunit O [Cyanobacteriota bacterium]